MTTFFFAKCRNLGLPAVLGLFVLSGCGRPATKAECQEIMRTAARLELSERLGSQQLIEEELTAIEKSMEKPMMEKCVGKPITDSKMECIRQAKTTKELFDGCF